MRKYWLKLQADFFQSIELKKLKSLSSDYIIIYIKLLLQSMDKGYITYDGIGDNLEEELSLIIDEDAELIKETISALIKLKLLRVDSDKYILTESKNLVKSESDSAERVRNHREKKSIEKENKMLHCNNEVTKCNGDVTEDELIESANLSDKEIVKAEDKKMLQSNSKVTVSNKKIEKEKIIFFSELDADGREIFRTWLRHIESKKSLTVNATSALEQLFVDNISKYGLDAVRTLVLMCISKDYKEVYWNRLTEFKPNKDIKKEMPSTKKDYSGSFIK